MNNTMLALIVATATNCPLVDIAGKYTFDLRTEQASSWYGVDGNFGCRKTARTEWHGISIKPDGTMVAGEVVWSQGGAKSGVFAGRVEPSSEPMQWVGSAGNVEMKGTWRRGQLSGEFVQRFIEGGKEVECRGKVSGFKTGN